jgi:hypothetical protein
MCGTNLRVPATSAILPIGKPAVRQALKHLPERPRCFVPAACASAITAHVSQTPFDLAHDATDVGRVSALRKCKSRGQRRRRFGGQPAFVGNPFSFFRQENLSQQREYDGGQDFVSVFPVKLTIRHAEENALVSRSGNRHNR